MGKGVEASPISSKGQAGADPYSIPLDKIDVSDSEIFESDTLWGVFRTPTQRRIPSTTAPRASSAPTGRSPASTTSSMSRRTHEIFSSARSIVVGDPDPDFPLEAGFITMDGPRHLAHRKVVQPVAAPRNLKLLEPLIRERVIEILDGLPVGETFDWVDRVSIELTTGMLATLFDFPYEQRRKLTFWSDMATASPDMVGAGWYHRRRNAGPRSWNVSRCLPSSGRSGRTSRRASVWTW